MDCELLSWEASSINIEEGVCRGCVDTSILFYSYGIAKMVPYRLPMILVWAENFVEWGRMLLTDH